MHRRLAAENMAAAAGNPREAALSVRADQNLVCHPNYILAAYTTSGT